MEVDNRVRLPAWKQDETRANSGYPAVYAEVSQGLSCGVYLVKRGAKFTHKILQNVIV